MATIDDIHKVWTMLCVAYPNHFRNVPYNVLDETLALYERLLSDIDPALLEAATIQHIAASQFFPSIADLRSSALALQKRAVELPSAYEAWGLFLEEVRRIGSYGTPEFKSPVLAKVVASLGWRDLCLSENQVSDRARFIEAYTIECQRETENMNLLPDVRRVVEALAVGRKEIEGKK
jgi:hypothetical protein